MNFRRYWDTPFFVELLLLAVTAPILYFPSRFSSGELAFTIGLLTLGWVWRRFTIGVWFRRTPADWPLFFLFLVMLPISVWAAPGPLREQYSIPRALILVWNFFLFWTVVSHAGRRRELFHLCVAGFGAVGVGIAVAALFGTQWIDKFPVVGPLLARLPKPLLGMFVGADEGFNPNQLAGTLLYVLPLFVALASYDILRERKQWRKWLPVSFAAGIIGLLLFLSQSRGGLLGFSTALILMLLVNKRWGRWTLGIGAILLILALPLIPFASIFSATEDFTASLGSGVLSLKGRPEIWNRALMAISDFPFTGLGLGTFRRIVHIFYPFFSISASFDIGHAHNFFLQTALDTGLPGLISLLSLYCIAILQSIRLWKSGLAVNRVWAIGMFGTLAAQIVYGQFDAVAMGAKTNFLFWYQMALLFTITQIGTERIEEGTNNPDNPRAMKM